MFWKLKMLSELILWRQICSTRSARKLTKPQFWQLSSYVIVTNVANNTWPIYFAVTATTLPLCEVKRKHVDNITMLLKAHNMYANCNTPIIKRTRIHKFYVFEFYRFSCFKRYIFSLFTYKLSLNTKPCNSLHIFLIACH